MEERVESKRRRRTERSGEGEAAPQASTTERGNISFMDEKEITFDNQTQVFRLDRSALFRSQPVEKWIKTKEFNGEFSSSEEHAKQIWVDPNFVFKARREEKSFNFSWLFGKAKCN
ncbi:hypothetical protein AAC387_Pa03g1771 [Persea americana]